MCILCCISNYAIWKPLIHPNTTQINISIKSAFRSNQKLIFVWSYVHFSHCNLKCTIVFVTIVNTVTIKGIKDPGQFKIDLIAGTSEVGFFHDKFGLMSPDEISTAALDMLLSS